MYDSKDAINRVFTNYLDPNILLPIRTIVLPHEIAS
jgi:hypothetical protein